MSLLEQRRAQLVAVQRSSYRRWFLASGRARRPLSDPRIAWQVPLVLFGGDATDRRLANAILRHAENEPCHFRPCYAAATLARFAGRLEPAVAARVRDYLYRSLRRAVLPDIRYHGFNDNFPSLATATLALAARVLDVPAAREHARKNLAELTRLLRRRVWLSEFNSPTYTPITLAALAEAAEFSDDAEVRELALHAEHRVWDDIAAHWHGPTGLPAGPYSRAYECDRRAQFTTLHIPIWLVSGPACFLDPIGSLFPPAPGQILHHEGDRRFLPGMAASLSVAPYHPPPDIPARLWRKHLPAAVVGDSEHGAMGASRVAGRRRVLYGCSSNYTTTWLAPEFSLGTSRRPFLDGNQSCGFLAQWRVRERPRNLADLRSCFTLYAVDDQTPGQRNPSPLQRAPLTRDQTYDHGRWVSLQHESTALVLYRPKLELAGRPVRRLALQIAFPLRGGVEPEIWLGGRRLKRPAARAGGAQPVTLREAATVLHFNPLPGAAGLTTCIRRRRGYLVIEYANFAGPGRRTLDETALAALSNGFVCRVRTFARSASLAPLLDELTQATIEDEFQADRRTVTYRDNGLKLSLAWCPATETIQAATINDQIVPA